MDCRASCRFGQQRVKVAKIFLEFAKLFRRCVGCGFVDAEGELGLLVMQLGFEDLAGAGDGVTLFVEERLDAENHFDVAAAVEALTGAAFVRFELREFALPETEDVGWKVAEFGDFADAEVEFVRDFRPGGWGSSADWLVLRHAKAPNAGIPASSQYRTGEGNL